MSNKIFIFLLIILGLNTGRYASYLIEGSESIYYIIALTLHLIGIVTAIILKVRINRGELKED